MLSILGRAACLAALLLALSAGAASANPAPVITEAGATNPIAYELKSLRWTHFYATFDQPVWVVLTVHDGTGREVARVFDGAVPNAGERFWFPSWNGKTNLGARLPSSAGYTWRIRAYRSGWVTENTARIAVTKVIFTIYDTPGNPGEVRPSTEQVYSRYLTDGSANVYMTIWNRDACDVQVTMPQAPGAPSTAGNVGTWKLDPNHMTSATVYLRPPSWQIVRGSRDIGIDVKGADKVQMTVLQ